MQRGPCSYAGGILLLAALNVGSPAYAWQFTYTVSEQLRAGSGSEQTLIAASDKRYFENLVQLLVAHDAWTAGLRLDYDSAPEYGRFFRGIRKKFVEYRDGTWSVRLGDTPVLLNKGLTLNSFEKKSLAFDTEPIGAAMEYAGKSLSVKAVWGENTYYDYVTLGWNSPREERHTIRAAAAELNSRNGWTLGFSVTNVLSRLPTLIPGSTNDVSRTLPELSLKLTFDNFQLDMTGALAVNSINTAAGAANGSLYALLSGWGETYGVTFEYRDYRFDPVDPIERSNPIRPTAVMAYQHPPAGFREHSFLLLNRGSHIADFNDETGVQLDGYLTVSERLRLEMNAALASRHYVYEFRPAQFAYRRVDMGGSYLPDLEDARSPAWELFLLTDWQIDPVAMVLRAGFDSRGSVVYDDLHPSYSQKENASTIVLQAEHQFSRTLHARVTCEYLVGRRQQGPANDTFTNIVAASDVIIASFLSVAVRSESTTDPKEASDKRSWLVGEVVVKPWSNMRLACSYGSERGGLVCSGGVCRFVQAFDGIRVSLSTILN